MKQVTLDFSSVRLRYELHQLLKEQFDLPDWYGMNLDALYDCLTDISEDTEVRLVGTAGLQERLERYGLLTLKVLREASRENDHLTVLEEE